MLTEQQLTEDIEIDDEPVEQNATHSLFFDTYYNSLKDIELANNQLLDAQEQLRWYTSQLDEVDRLADEARIPNSSTISVKDLPRVIKLDRTNDEKDFQSFALLINRFRNLDLDITSIANKIRELESKIKECRLEIKKTSRYYVMIAVAILIPYICSGLYHANSECARNAHNRTYNKAEPKIFYCL
jgi:hypothetical protein